MNKPEIKIKFANNDLKVLELKGKVGDLLPDHEVNIPAILSVRAGQVKYSQSGSNMKLITGDFKLIPPNVVHNLEFEAESCVELTLFSDSKIKFIKNES